MNRTADPAWARIVVIAHSARHRPPASEGPNRIALRANDDPAGDIPAVLLPDRLYLALRSAGEVLAVGA
jgi:hypothetical protein